MTNSARCSKARSACSIRNRMGPMLEEKYGIPRRRLTGLMSSVVLQASRSLRRRHLAIPRRQDPAVAAAPDRDCQDRARRREQPGYLVAGRQGRHPQARNLRPERSRRLQLFRRTQPRQPGRARVRRDVQGADQDAASVADGDAGRQLHRHREYRRDPVHRRHPRALQREPNGRASRPTRTTRPSSIASASSRCRTACASPRSRRSTRS